MKIATSSPEDFNRIQRSIEISEYIRRLEEVWQKNPEESLGEMIEIVYTRSMTDEELTFKLEERFGGNNETV